MFNIPNLLTDIDKVNNLSLRTVLIVLITPLIMRTIENKIITKVITEGKRFGPTIPILALYSWRDQMKNSYGYYEKQDAGNHIINALFGSHWIVDLLSLIISI